MGLSRHLVDLDDLAACVHSQVSISCTQILPVSVELLVLTDSSLPPHLLRCGAFVMVRFLVCLSIHLDIFQFFEYVPHAFHLNGNRRNCVEQGIGLSA